MIVTRVIDFVHLPEDRTTPTDPGLWSRVVRWVFRWFQRIAPNKTTLNRRIGTAGLSLIGLSYLGMLGLFVATIVVGGLLAVDVPETLADQATELTRVLDQLAEVLPDPLLAVLGMVPTLPLVGVFGVLLALVGLALFLMAVRWSLSRNTIVESRLDWLTVPQVNVSRALDHLAGPTGNGNLAGGEVVVARLTAQAAEELKQIPEWLPERIRRAWLHPVLVAIEAAPHNRIGTVAEYYNLTLLVDESMTPEIRPVLVALARSWEALNERESLSGVGTATLQRINPSRDGPSIDDNLAGGRGDPLHERQAQELRGNHPPTAVIALVPPGYQDLVQQKLTDRKHEETAIEVRERPQATITIVRLFVNEEFYWE